MDTENDISRHKISDNKNDTFTRDTKQDYISRDTAEFKPKEQELPELDVEMLAAIRDQLLLQKMYENDLEKFKSYKKTTKGKKRKTKNRNKTSKIKFL